METKSIRYKKKNDKFVLLKFVLKLFGMTIFTANGDGKFIHVYDCNKDVSNKTVTAIVPIEIKKESIGYLLFLDKTSRTTHWVRTKVFWDMGHE